MEDHNKVALKLFIYQPVNIEMISFLANAANAIIPTRSMVTAHDLPTLEEFIVQLVVKSNVQVPTLMSTVVFLTRLKSKLQGNVTGLRCTPHRIFLASLILASKYLNDNSPKNKHWANYTHIKTNVYSFGFNRVEERQLLSLLDWELGITERDLYRELRFFLRQYTAMYFWHGGKRTQGDLRRYGKLKPVGRVTSGPTRPHQLGYLVQCSRSQQSHWNTPLNSQPKSGSKDMRQYVPYTRCAYRLCRQTGHGPHCVCTLERSEVAELGYLLRDAARPVRQQQWIH